MKLKPMDIYKLLPKTNCKKCGLPSCMAFAVRFIERKVGIEDCPELNTAKYLKQKLKLKEIASQYLKATETKLVVHEEKCMGCGSCVIACPPNVSVSLEASGGKGPREDVTVLVVKDGVVKPANLKLCRRFEGDIETRPCTVCVDSCPTKAIEFL